MGCWSLSSPPSRGLVSWMVMVRFSCSLYLKEVGTQRVIPPDDPLLSLLDGWLTGGLLTVDPSLIHRVGWVGRLVRVGLVHRMIDGLLVDGLVGCWMVFRGVGW